MRADVLIVGQGLAGTLLAWECEQAGIAFEIADRGHETSASMAAGAGIVNPITGRRLVKSWRVADLLPIARESYHALGLALGAPVWRERRVRRLFADERERAAFAAKRVSGELAPYADEGDEEGFWIGGAGQVDLCWLLEASRARWRLAGRLREEAAIPEEETGRHGVVVDCRGVAGTESFHFVPWEFSKGEVLAITVGGLEPEVILNRRHWIAPAGEGRAWVGATHGPGERDAAPSEAGRVVLETSARGLLGGKAFAVTGRHAGVRVVLSDKRPAAGRHPDNERLGLINGLGAKGVLWAPWLARQWVRHLAAGEAFDPEIDVRRFAEARRD